MNSWPVSEARAQLLTAGSTGGIPHIHAPNGARMHAAETGRITRVRRKRAPPGPDAVFVGSSDRERIHIQ